MLKLHDYQEVAIHHLLGPGRGKGLFLDMGLGKTAVVLSALTSEHLPALVVAPKRVAEETWPTERTKWRPDLRLSLAAGPPAKRREALEAKADVYVIGRDNLGDLDGHPLLGKVKTLVLDELSSFKNPGSGRFKSLRRVVTKNKTIQHIWGLTGTPSPNGLLGLWPQMYLLDQGKSLGTTLGGFRSRYFTPGWQLPSGVVTEWHLRPGADARIHGLIESTCLSMGTDGRLPDLPPTTYQDFEVSLPAPAVRIYDDMKNDLVADLDLLGGEIHSAANAATLSGKLSQITSGALYVDDADLRGGIYKEIHSEKLAAVLEIIEGTGSPVLLFYRFRHEEERLKKHLTRAGIRVRSVKEQGVVPAWNRGEVQVLLAHPASAGHGLNLQHGGHTIIWCSLDWDLEFWKQGNKRLARQGQTSPVIIHSVMARRTIDYAIQKRLEGKASVEDALLGHLESVIA